MSAKFLEPSDLVATLADWLTPWAKKLKGKVSVAQDAFDVLQILADSPVGFLAVVHWEGDADNSDDQHTGIVTNSFKIILSQGRGLNVKPGANLIQSRAGQPPLYALVSLCRAHVARLMFSDPADEISSVWAQYKGTSPFVVPGVQALDAQEVRFALDSAVDLGGAEAEASSSEAANSSSESASGESEAES